jgi:hypothetical protein
MKEKIFNKIVNELLRSLNVRGISDAELDLLKKDMIVQLYGKIILKAIEIIDEEQKKDFIKKIKTEQTDINKTMSIIQEFIASPEDMIADVMMDYKNELEKII